MLRQVGTRDQRRRSPLRTEWAEVFSALLPEESGFQPTYEPTGFQPVVVQFVDACHALVRDKGTSTLSVYAQKRLDSAHRRYLLAVKTLAVVRKLLKLGEAADKESTEVKEIQPVVPKRRGRPPKIRQEVAASGTSPGTTLDSLAPADEANGHFVHLEHRC